ncbi:MAG: DNA repair protein RecO [Elusimicrobiota bacterium]|nr:DNA repair protein RecO [Endomicrobiia bacterium]MDW8165017.1 DNA repair protein RecO [Elusimicrobiota bacterium]
MYNLIDGFILNRKNVLEYDKIATIYTLQLGKIKVLFKGINKITSKSISYTEPATEVELQVVKLKNKNYDTIFKFAGGKIVNFNQQLRKSFRIYEYTCKILDLIDALTLELMKDENKYFLIKRVFEFLPNSKNLELIFLAFAFRFIKLCGYMPELSRCIKCKRVLNSSAYFFFFDFINRGIICKECRNISSDLRIIEISLDTIKVIQKFYKLNAEQIDNLNVENKILKEISNFTFIYLQQYLNRGLKVFQYEN